MDGVVLGVLCGLATVQTWPVGAAQAATRVDSAPNYAAYTGTASASSATAVVRVSTLDCSYTAAGRLAGQGAGVRLTGGGVFAAAEIRTYCAGQTPVFAVEFALPRHGVEVYHSSALTVSPFDSVRLTVQLSATTALARAQNVTSHAADHFTSKDTPIHSGVPFFIMTTIPANASGGVLLDGKPTAGNPTIPGPVSTAGTSERFTGSNVDGQPLGELAGLRAVWWMDVAHSTPLVAVSGLAAGGRRFDFAVLLPA